MDEFLRELDMRILKEMIVKGVASYNIRKYARARFKEEEITYEDLQEIDRLCEERDNPPVEELATEQVSEQVEEETTQEEPLSEDEGSFENPVESEE